MTRWSVMGSLLASLWGLVVAVQDVSGDDATAVRAAVESIRTDDLRKHLWTLASDSLEGREAGSRGGNAAAAYLRKQMIAWDCQGGGDDGDFFQEFGTGFRNVLAVVRGSDPELRDEFIIVGAHYDHVGYGNARNSRGPWGLVHNGADDNASGTAGLLEVLEAVIQHPLPLRRSLLIAFWDAEEKGLLGSAYWLKQPTISLDKVHLVINSDMIGRLQPDALLVQGSRTGVGLRRLASFANHEANLKLDFSWKIEDNSDHWPFYRRQIPFLMLHTGLHDDYHRPSDDVEKIDLDGTNVVARYMLSLAIRAANEAQIPFRRESYDEDVQSQARFEMARKPFPPRLGITWDAELDAEGVIQVSSVRGSSPAERAGIQVGDRIFEFDGTKLNRANDIRYLVQRAPVETTCRILRVGESEPVALTVQLDHSPLTLGVAWQTDPADPQCVVLTDIAPGSPLDKAGVKRGDRVYAIAGETIETDADFRQKVLQKALPTVWTIERDGYVREVDIAPAGLDLTDRPPADAPGTGSQ